MHAEEYFLDPSTKSILRDTSQKRLAIGTTCVRTIEHYLGTDDPYYLSEFDDRIYFTDINLVQGYTH